MFLTIIASVLPFILGLYLFVRIFRMLHLYRIARNKTSSKNPAIQARSDKHSPAYHLTAALLSAVLCYYSFVLGANYFPVDVNVYTLNTCQQSALSEQIGADETVRFKHMLSALKQCEE